MKFIPYTHKIGILKHVLVGKYEGTTGSGDVLDEKSKKLAPGIYYTTINEKDMSKLDLESAISIELDPRDIVLFN